MRSANFKEFSLGGTVSQEVEFQARLTIALEHIESQQPLTAIDAETLKPVFTKLLTEHGHLDEVLQSRECLESLREPKLERLNTGRGRAVVTTLDGNSKYQQIRQIFISSPDDATRAKNLGANILDTKIGVFRAWATSESTRLPGLGDSADNEYTKRRGFEQLLGDTISLSAGLMTPEEYADKVNQRARLAEKPSTVSRIPKKSLPDFFNFVTALCLTPAEEIQSLRSEIGLTNDKVDLEVIMGLDSKKPLTKK